MTTDATGRCSRGCGAPCRWLLSLADYRVCINWPTPDPTGTVVLRVVDGRERAQILPGAQLPAQETAYRLHECPKPPIGPACASCGLPMHAALSRLLRWITHPTCGPEWREATQDRPQRRRK